MSQPSIPVEALPAVEAALNYLVPMAARPRNYTFDPPPGEPRSNAEHAAHRTTIRSLRTLAPAATLDTHGFKLAEHASEVRDFYDEEEVRATYYPEAERLLQYFTGAERVHVFDHVVRRRVAGASDDRGGGPRQPAWRVHVDHTARSGPQRVRDLLGAEADALLRGRVQVINVWRPLHGPLHDAPLAVAEAGSVAPADLVPSDLVYRHRVGETYSVTHNPAHRWFYVPEMRAEEALLLKCFDSKTDGRARFAPHSAFLDPTAPKDARPRESVELRTLVFHGD